MQNPPCDITDKRVFVGAFAGTDQPLNILLDDTEEYRLLQEPSGETLSGSESKAPALEKEVVVDRRTRRYVGKALIPWRIVTKIEVHNPWWVQF